MAILVWVMTGLAIWHFTVYVPDKFLWGIVGAFVGACIGAVVSGMILSLAVEGAAIPGRDDVDVLTLLLAIPGTLGGMGLMYAVGASRENAAAAAH